MTVTIAPYSSEPTMVVLHALRIGGRVPTASLPALTGLDATVLERELDAAADDGLVSHHDGVLAGWSLTADGRDRHRLVLADERASAACNEVIEDGYQRLLALNGWFKTLCTEWQLHDHPRSCVERLTGRHGEVLAIANDLAAAITRFAPYSVRFDDALRRLRRGDTDAFVRPLTGSYHDVWMQLHEDLLLTLDRRRSGRDET